MKKNSATKKIIPAAAMLCISAAMLATSTYAWFTMNKDVSVSTMTINARGEGGIVIGRKADSDNRTNSGTTDTVSYSATLYPTSTKDASDWYHATAQKSSAHDAIANTKVKLNEQTGYEKTAQLTQNTPGKIKVNEKEYVLFDTFTVWPDTNATQYKDLWISECKVSSATKKLSKSMRVAFVCGENVVICAPCRISTDSTELTYSIGTNNESVTAKGTSDISNSQKTDGFVLFDGDMTESDTGKDVSVYLYFEGEDKEHFTDNLKEDNATAIENLALTFKLQCTEVSSEPVATTP